MSDSVCPRVLPQPSWILIFKFRTLARQTRLIWSDSFERLNPSLFVDANRMDTEHGLSLGQVVVDQKSNEITAIPQLLQMQELRGSLVTIDAMECQKEIAKQIVQDGGDFCLAVKKNQPKLHDAIEAFFDDAGENDFSKNDCDCWATDEVSRGRREHRNYVVSPVTNEMSRTFKGWKGLESIGRTISMVERCGKETVETRYYILSKALSAKQFGKAVRCHWGIESMHWILDVTFNEDASQITKGHGP